MFLQNCMDQSGSNVVNFDAHAEHQLFSDVGSDLHSTRKKIGEEFTSH